jgi:hypothetical protein
VGRFRLITFLQPLVLPRHFLQISDIVQLQPSFHERIHKVELPSGAQLALRPLVRENDRWVDPLRKAERDFAIVPSTILDLPALHGHTSELITIKQSKLLDAEKELADLQHQQKAALTGSEPSDRLNTLRLYIPKAATELETLQARAAAIPKIANSIERFALFLCLSNVNTEIIRFEGP